MQNNVWEPFEKYCVETALDFERAQRIKERLYFALKKNRVSAELLRHPQLGGGASLSVKIGNCTYGMLSCDFEDDFIYGSKSRPDMDLILEKLSSPKIVETVSKLDIFVIGVPEEIQPISSRDEVLEEHTRYQRSAKVLTMNYLSLQQKSVDDIVRIIKKTVAPKWLKIFGLTL